MDMDKQFRHGHAYAAWTWTNCMNLDIITGYLFIYGDKYLLRDLIRRGSMSSS
jgi:hypothetical protein